MKLVTRDSDTTFLYNLKQVLESHGIPAFISGENTNRMLPSFLMSHAGLWVYLDDQHYDASQLILNHNHVVTTAIDVEGFYNAQPNEKDMQSSLNKVMIQLAIFFAAIAVCIIVFTSIF